MQPLFDIALVLTLLAFLSVAVTLTRRASTYLEVLRRLISAKSTPSRAQPAINPIRSVDIISRPPVLLTRADYRELSSVIVAAKKLGLPVTETNALHHTLAHATVHGIGSVPPDRITMYSRMRLVDVETNERLQLVLVYPVDANIAEGRISVLHPLGAALLGRATGDHIEWPVPYGVRRFGVQAVDFQPEAALASAA
jgi:regulator of nucleoside diphosphate kinase